MVDFYLGDLGGGGLLLDLVGGLLGGVQLLDELFVVQNSLRVCSRQGLKQVSFQFIQLHFELVLGFHELLLLLLDVGSFFVHDSGQQLVLKPGFGYDEVDDGTLSGSLRSEMRVKQLGHKVQFEVDVIIDLLSSHVQDVVVTLLLDGSR